VLEDRRNPGEDYHTEGDAGAGRARGVEDHTEEGPEAVEVGAVPLNQADQTQTQPGQGLGRRPDRDQGEQQQGQGERSRGAPW